MPAHSVSSQSSAITLKGGGAQRVHLARDGGGEGHEVLGRVGHVAEFVAVRIVDLRDRVERGHLAGGDDVGQAADGRRRGAVLSGADHDD